MPLNVICKLFRYITQSELCILNILDDFTLSYIIIVCKTVTECGIHKILLPRVDWTQEMFSVAQRMKIFFFFLIIYITQHYVISENQ